MHKSGFHVQQIKERKKNREKRHKTKDVYKGK